MASAGHGCLAGIWNAALARTTSCCGGLSKAAALGFRRFSDADAWREASGLGDSPTLEELVAFHVGRGAAGRSPAGKAAVAPGPGLTSWREGEPSSFRLRIGPSYPRSRCKAAPGPPLYTCIGVEVVRLNGGRLRNAVGGQAGSVWSRGGGTKAPPLPDLPSLLVVNFQVPFERGPLLSAHPADDHGCNVLLFFALREQVASESTPGRRLLARCLREEGHPLREGTHVTGCFKAVGVIENIDDLSIPAAVKPIVRNFNGKPVLVERETVRYFREDGVVELSVDIRGFNPVATNCLWLMRDTVLQRAHIQLGLLVQACKDDELPEQLIGAVRLCGLDLNDARELACFSDVHEGAATAGGAADGGRRGWWPPFLRRRAQSGPTEESFCTPRSHCSEVSAAMTNQRSPEWIQLGLRSRLNSEDSGVSSC